MEVKYYQVAGLSICLQSEFETRDTEVTAPFLTEPCQAQVMCYLRVADELERPQGEMCLQEDMLEVYRQGDSIYRCLMVRGNEERVYMLSKKDAHGPMELWARRSELGWCCQMGYIFLAMGLGSLLLEQNRLVMHSSLIDTGRGAVLFTAPSGTGKSTQAGLWETFRGTEIINGDRCALGLIGGKPVVYGVPMAGTSGISKNKTLPLRAIVTLEQAGENQVIRLCGAEALLKVGFCSVIDRWNPEAHLVAMDILSRIMEQSPVFLLRCRPDEGAVEALSQALEAIK